QELINKISPDLKNVLHKAFEDERLKIKIDNKGQLEKETRKKIEKKSNERPENLMFRCPKCENIIRVKIEIFNEWKKSGLKQKNILQEKFWTCDVCDHLLNPLDDKYKRGPIRGKRIMTIMLEEGMIAHILADRIGRNGPRSVYIPEDSVIKINAEHSLLIYSVKTSDEAFKCNLLDSIIFSIAAKRSKNNNQSFEAVYNELCAKVNKVINIQEYEEALSQLKVEINN
ncbi:MAG: hypothetical protein Q7U68_02600, partial [Candidatus Roizmanbacteria bacterium]|nr:hypothetical protein [Candidatus Roizmanbacteria bacterium]